MVDRVEHDGFARLVAMDVAIWARHAGKPAGWSFALRSLALRPGFLFVLGHRIARSVRSWPLIGGVLFRVGLFLLEATWSSEIGAEAQIGGGLYTPHPFGMVIGNGCVIGRDVTVLQNVTLGRRNPGAGGVPVVKDGAMLGAGAVILGAITIGERAKVAANALVLDDVPPDGVAIGNPATVTQRQLVRSA
ncbi:serine O-acetyltransferase [Croceicoccus gelatinilyticus]|uniref:serine O-acetyltransferase n=1 Tax=Croceicoccus gelatinilyticus TaxID=2835536 RepID=UPI001BCCAC7D|nr:serine acetyltransferase [Croceicoccus gelatinilyticus]MBS7668935.1 serine acetyltransferase [Croceicoccus gelatinilyticus]